MKVTIEGTAQEFVDMAELITYGRSYRNSLGVPEDPDASQRDVQYVQARDDVPNRFREEGVQ